MIVFVTLIFFCSPIGSKQRDLDDFVNAIGTAQHHEHFLHVLTDYRSVLLSYIMVLQVIKLNFRRRIVRNYDRTVLSDKMIRRPNGI
jgi:hypothetical protein